MSREIKFRGINNETKQFVYGYYTKLLEGCRIIDAIICENDVGDLVRFYIHESKTIGQFTGLKDKNGVDIYEGDIVKAPDFFHEAPDTACTVVFSKPNAGWGLECCNVCEPIHNWFCNDGSSALEVIGNTHQHPELLEG